jgi:signal transduction histidine kinase
LVDVAVAVVVVGLSLPATVRGGPRPAWAWGLDLALVVPLVWRRREPTVVFSVVAAVALVQWAVDLQRSADLALLVALYTVAARQDRRRALAAAGVLEVGVLLAAARFAPAGDDVVASVVFLTGMVAAAFFVGTTVQNRRAYLDALVDRAARAEREADQQARLAATAERTRIARELHDIVAHSLTVVVTLAEAAVATSVTDPPAARAAMSHVATTGRSALAEMRRLLGVLRTDATGTDMDPEVSAAQRTPAPGLDRLDELVAQTRSAGLPVRLTVSGLTRPLPTTLETTAYRVLQESVTNVLRHAVDPTHLDIGVHWAPDALVIDVHDDGRPPPATPDGAGGHGLTGMRERLAVFGAQLTVGPAPSGGWSVHACIPCASELLPEQLSPGPPE